MDPLLLASSFATIVGLLFNYKQEKKDQASMSYQDFLQWLENRDTAVKEFILQSHGLLQSQVEHILREGHERIMADLSKFDIVLATLLTHLEGFAEIATLLKPNSGLSEQSLHILQRFVDSDAEELSLDRAGTGEIFLSLFIQAPDSEIDVAEPRFLDDDLGTLVDAGLLIPRRTGHGHFFKLTRNAARLIEALRDGHRLPAVR